MVVGKRDNRKYAITTSSHIYSSQYSVPYAALAHTFSLIESTTKRLEKTAYLTSFLLLVIQRSAPGDYESLLHTIYLCINRVRLFSFSFLPLLTFASWVAES